MNFGIAAYLCALIAAANVVAGPMAAQLPLAASFSLCRSLQQQKGGAARGTSALSRRSVNGAARFSSVSHEPEPLAPSPQERRGLTSAHRRPEFGACERRPAAYRWVRTGGDDNPSPSPGACAVSQIAERP